MTRQPKHQPKRNRTRLKHDLQQVINELTSIGCTFNMCPGPNKPAVNMLTCRMCWQIKELRRIRDEL